MQCIEKGFNAATHFGSRLLQRKRFTAVKVKVVRSADVDHFGGSEYLNCNTKKKMHFSESESKSYAKCSWRPFWGDGE